MKKNLLTAMLFIASMAIYAQKDVTTFLGIPVDGSKAEMKQKLISKGFTYNSRNDNFEGEFNGRDVCVYIVTNNNKVWRIMIADENTCGETDIKIRFNNLCGQFAKNAKYMARNLEQQSYTIPEDEKISYEMLVHNKRYEAAYYQAPVPELMDTVAMQRKVLDILLQEYTQEQIDNPTDAQQKKMQEIVERESIKIAFDLMEKKSVWFMISENYGRYYITMFYDNEYNHSNGEDL